LEFSRTIVPPPRTPEQAKRIEERTALVTRWLKQPPSAWNSAQADIYAVGMIIQRLFAGGAATGVLPLFGMLMVALNSWICEGAPHARQSNPLLTMLHRFSESEHKLEGIQKSLKPVVGKALARKAEDRFGSCREFRDALFSVTGWQPLPVEFMMSHTVIVQHGGAVEVPVERDSHGQCHWDLSPWTLSPAHLGRVQDVLRCPDFGQQIGKVTVRSFTPVVQTSTVLRQDFGMLFSKQEGVTPSWGFEADLYFGSSKLPVDDATPLWEDIVANFASPVLMLAGRLDLSLQPAGYQMSPAELDIICEAIPQSVHLMELHLPYCGLGETGCVRLADALRDNTSLSILDLAGNDAGAQGAEELADKVITHHPNLKKVDLANNSLLSSGTIKIGEALHARCVLEHLNLRSNDITMEGGRRFAEGLLSNASLRTVDFSNNDVGALAVSELLMATRLNTGIHGLRLDGVSLGVQGAVVFHDNDLVLFADSCLTTLRMRRCNLGSVGAAALFGVLQDNSCLARLDLGWNDIGQIAGEALAECLADDCSLRALDVSDNRLGDQSKFGERMRMCFAENTNTMLQYLNLSGNRLTAECMAGLAEALKQMVALEHLLLHNNPHISAGFIFLGEVVWECDRLQDLGCSLCGITDSDLAQFLSAATGASAFYPTCCGHSMRGLTPRRLRLSSDGRLSSPDPGSRGGATPRQAESVGETKRCGSCGLFTDQQGGFTCYTCPQTICTTCHMRPQAGKLPLEQLDLGHNYLSDTGGAALGALIAGMSAGDLRCLSLSFNGIGDVVGTDVLEWLAAAREHGWTEPRDEHVQQHSQTGGHSAHSPTLHRLRTTTEAATISAPAWMRLGNRSVVDRGKRNLEFCGTHVSASTQQKIRALLGT